MKDNNIADELINKIKTIKDSLGAKNSKRYNFDLTIRIIKRLNEHDCQECKKYLDEIKLKLDLISSNLDYVNKPIFKQYTTLISHIKQHLYKVHTLVTEGYYLTIYMPIGMMIGAAIGSGIGFPAGISIGLCIGLAIGSGFDADAKKKGKVI